MNFASGVIGLLSAKPSYLRRYLRTKVTFKSYFLTKAWSRASTRAACVDPVALLDE
jgi:hypothetical protein